MARRRHRTEIEVTATATVCISDVLEEVSTDQLMEELKGRDDYAGGGFQPPIDAVFLEDLARALELGRHMDAPERRLAALKLREMIDPDQQRSARVAADYAKWQAARSATPTYR